MHTATRMMSSPSPKWPRTQPPGGVRSSILIRGRGTDLAATLGAGRSSVPRSGVLVGHAAQQDRLLTSWLKVWAASLRASAMVR